MSNLTPTQQEQVAQALYVEYKWIGVKLVVARQMVAEGKWDDHPAAKN